MSSATDRVRRRRALPLVAALAAAAPPSAFADDLNMSVAGIVANPFQDSVGAATYRPKSKQGKGGKTKGGKAKPPSASPTATGSPSALPSVSPTEGPSVAPSVSPTKGPSVSPSVSPSAAPSNSIDYCFRLQGPGTCQDENGGNYDFIEMIATTHDIADVPSCVRECIDLIPGSPGVEVLTGVVAGFENGTVNDICRCQYPDGLLPAINLSGGSADGTFFCPAKASQCFGKFDSVKEVSTSESVLPVGTCFKNHCYEEPGTMAPTATPGAK